MRDPLPLLADSDFPPLRRGRLHTLQVNVGYRCNQSCVHCHVNAGPKREEAMSAEVAALVVRYLDASEVSTLDITGGAPELNPEFRFLVREARARGLQVIDRCNLTILEEPDQEDLAAFLAGHGVTVVASMPCYLEENVNGQRGKGVFDASIRGLRRLNALGYGDPDSSLALDLVYNPQGATLPPAQQALEADYRRILGAHYGIRFNRLLTLANMPVGRFGSSLISRGAMHEYLAMLRDAHQDENLDSVMCRSLLSIDWQGYVYDCDFNQMLGLPMRINGASRVHLAQLMDADLEGRPIAVRAHCYACTAGQGSSCGGALA
ncbi:MAG: radical SAM/Cys-rich domain protein [Gammaproteobacteria bacterium]|nr:radical SAM/Cys-rich domain protein [Gammaproteobacteria bacterium]NIM73906.1 radical SAM/Cys-rich domain protein [Gammaproteobacteria bacterium]NIN38094.1 radical SAM/Cys-rich domain protein [Gammaproteobacteria bacterium]NIO25687.1 radical SAM/Cys-rich domain protein [Gammaproteobacteria bacterium]NIO66321.1 radical SAM/Cys-rich domain protein [Gammaproteobacteria bacterium]